MLLLLGALAINAAISVWSVKFLERELSKPLQSIQPVLEGMYRINRVSDTQRSMLSTTRAQTQLSGEIRGIDLDALTEQIIELEVDAELAGRSLTNHPSILLRSGTTTIQNLGKRSEQISAAARALQENESVSSYDNLESLIFARHELVERVRGQVIEDTRLVADYGRQLRLAVIAIIAFSIISVIACIVLAGVLVRRWITSPLEKLREGARRLGHGELGHRISVDSDDEIGQLADEFNQMAVLLTQLQDERVEQERFAAMGEMAQRTVHNLRTPLSGIRSLAETSNQELPSDSTVRELQTRIISTVDRFEGWLQQILRVSSPAELHPAPIDPADLIRSVVGNHIDAASSRRIKIAPKIESLPPSVLGDRHHLEHALTAILSNAIDFAPLDSTIELTARGDEAAGYWTVRIANAGPSIEESLHASIFRPYFTTRSGGTGIGLAVVKSVVVQHGGEITVESPLNATEGSGTAFVCQLPLRQDSDFAARVANISQGAR